MMRFLQENRVTPEDIEAFILEEHYINAGDAATGVETPLAAQSLACQTFCVLVLKNGYSVYGHSACAHPDNFDEELGKQIARKNAIEKIWPLLGFMVRNQLHQIETAPKPTEAEMHTYVGEKVVHARPMTRAAYNTFRGWELPDDEDGNDLGYLVEYADGGRPNVPGYSGYISWSPADVFERAYRGGGA